MVRKLRSVFARSNFTTTYSYRQVDCEEPIMLSSRRICSSSNDQIRRSHQRNQSHRLQSDSELVRLPIEFPKHPTHANSTAPGIVTAWSLGCGHSHAVRRLWGLPRFEYDDHRNWYVSPPPCFVEDVQYPSVILPSRTPSWLHQGPKARVKTPSTTRRPCPQKQPRESHAPQAAS